MILFKESKSKEKIKQIKEHEYYRKDIERINDIYEQIKNKPIEVLPKSKFCIFNETGNRLIYEDVYFERRTELDICFLKYLLYERKEDLTRLEDIIWAICGEFSWALPAHVGWKNAEDDMVIIDLFAAETMINIEETLAAVDAVSSICDLPILCTMTVEADGSIFSGGNAVEAALALEAAGASAVGVNCSVGPDQLVSVIRNIRENVSIPVVAKPNAGMPSIDDQGHAVYNMTAEDFARHMKVLVENGASVIGGCCGTTPEFIRQTAQLIRSL